MPFIMLREECRNNKSWTDSFITCFINSLHHVLYEKKTTKSIYVF